ncbi:MAG: hydrogenase maturation protease [Epsilonproteobacteria bacterium]|nr:hydrogenase maturation protease [Campylobacterota bacterium]
MEKIAVVGAGNVLFLDEGVGIYAQKYLEENFEFDKDITIVDGGVLGFKLMTYYQDYDKVLILDTITMHNEEAGAIYSIPAEELLGLGSYKQNAHEVEIVEMLEICSLLDKMAEVQIVGIVPQNIIDVKTNLTPRLKANFDNFIKVALDELEKMGVRAIPKKRQKSLEEIINLYQNPKATRL